MQFSTKKSKLSLHITHNDLLKNFKLHAKNFTCSYATATATTTKNKKKKYKTYVSYNKMALKKNSFTMLLVALVEDSYVYVFILTHTHIYRGFG